MATYTDEALGDCQVGPEKGTVSFSAGLHNWAFTLTVFATMYAKKFGVEIDKMMEKLWGDNFFDPKTKKWTKKHTGEKTCQRAFVQFIYEPIRRVIDAAMNDNKEKLWPMLEKLGVKAKLKPADFDLMGKPLMKRVMQTWLPADVALLEMIIYHLPSPATAQKYRADTLYEGPLDDKYAEAIRNCDSDGPLMLYISKMIPTADKGRFLAFGRVFAGTVQTGQKVSFEFIFIYATLSLVMRAIRLTARVFCFRFVFSAPTTSPARRRICTSSPSSAPCCAWAAARIPSTPCRRVTPSRASAWTSTSPRTPPSPAKRSSRRTPSRR